MATLAFALPMRGQLSDYDTLCQARLMVMYEHTYHEDTNNINRAGKEKMLLLIGDEISCFQSFNNRRSFLKTRQMMLDGTWGTYISQPIYVKPDDIVHFMYRIYKNCPTGKTTTFDHVFMTGTFSYEEDYPCMTWEYTEDTATIAGYFTQKAVCDYGGRSWEAWFAPELPYSDGPYKFCGLPGLIVRLADTQDHYRFEMLSAEVLAEETIIFWKTEDVMKTTKKGFFKAYDDNLANIVENALPNILDADKNDIQKKLYNYAATKNNPIELDRK